MHAQPVLPDGEPRTLPKLAGRDIGRERRKMAENASERYHYVHYTHPEYGLLQGMVDHTMFCLLEAKDPTALAQFVDAVKPKKSTETHAETPAGISQACKQCSPDPKWNQSKEDCLLQVYHDLTESKAVWSWAQVAAKYGEMQPKISGESARLKIRSLREKYRRLEQHNKKTGNDPIEVPKLMETVFGTQSAIAVNTLENTPSTDSSEKSGPPSEDSVEEVLLKDEIGLKKKRKRARVGERQTGAQMVMNEMKAMKEEDRKVQNEQFQIKCELAKEMIQAIKGLHKDT